jgi:hypothetical protein
MRITPLKTIITLGALALVARGLMFFQEVAPPNLENNASALDVPTVLSFAGEPVPVNDVDVRERLDRELLVNTYWHSNMLLSFKRANRFFPVMEPILQQQGVPDDFKYLALIESGLANVLSPAGAAGFWQILKTTGSEYGLEIGKDVDERYHVEKATVAACAYLKAAKEKFGSWTAAAASYNMGMGGLNKQMARQGATNYYDLLLNSETSRYVFRIIAVKEIYENPAKYGFKFTKNDLYHPVPSKTVEIAAPIEDLAELAGTYGVTYKALKIHNPWLRDKHLKSHDKDTYVLEIPERGHYGTSAASKSSAPSGNNDGEE